MICRYHQRLCTLGLLCHGPFDVQHCLSHGGMNSAVHSSPFVSHSDSGSGPDPMSTNRLVESWKAKYSTFPAKSEAVFFIGPMGAGKSYQVNFFFSEESRRTRFAFVDTDEIMSELDGYSHDRAKDFYPIARNIAVQLTDWLLEHRISFVAEGTGVNYADMTDYLRRLRKADYTIQICFLDHVDEATALQRMQTRSRTVPADMASQIYHNSIKGCQMLREVCSREQLCKVIAPF